MRTRATALSPDHVNALYVVPLEFYGKRGGLPEIRAAWRAYLDHLSSPQNNMDLWMARRVDLFTAMLQRMATYLGYDFDVVELNREIYAPTGHAQVETDQEIIRRGLAELFSDRRPLNVRVM